MKENSDKKNNEKVKKKYDSISLQSTKKFFKELNFPQKSYKKDSADSKSGDQASKHDDRTFPTIENFLNSDRFKGIKFKDKKDSTDFKLGDQASNHDDHAFPIIENFLNSKIFESIKSKNKLLMGISLFISGLLIVIGIVLIMSPVEKVADNVIFGEKAEFSVFLILIGILIIASVFAHRLLDESFFKGVNKEIEKSKKTSSNSTEKNIKKDNINRDNK